jgi:hypothetical protein
MKFCAKCGTSVDETPVAPQPIATKLSHEHQVAILNDAIREFGALGWHEWAARPTPYETSLRRKSGVFARQFMALWVEEDGSVWTNLVGEGGSLRGLPGNFGKPPWNPTLVRSGPDQSP